MMFRPSHVVVGALVLIAAACDNSSNNFVQMSTATVRLVNDTDVPLALNNAGIIDSLNARVVFGQASACVLVNLSNTSVPILTITNGGTGATISFNPPLFAGANLLVVGFTGIDGTVQFATLDDRSVTAAGTAGVRFFNGVASTGPLQMRRNGGVLTPFVGLGAASGFASVPIDSADITFTTQSSVVLDAGPMAFPQGQNSTVLIGSPAPQSIPLRTFTVQGC